MSGPGPGYTGDQQPTGFPGELALTKEEKEALRECARESFWYRSLPFSVMGMAITQALIKRGSLSVSPKFGSLPKVAFAGFCGYVAGRISYVKTCQEKFERLENSPMGEALRQRKGLPRQYSRGPQSEVSDVDTSMQSLGTMFQSEAQSQTPSQSRDYGYEYSHEPPMPAEREEDLSVPDQSYMDEEEPRQKPILYEDLRLKNRENYEVTLTQKAETLMTPSPRREPERTKKEAKKNIYGDTWEE